MNRKKKSPKFHPLETSQDMNNETYLNLKSHENCNNDDDNNYQDDNDNDNNYECMKIIYVICG